MKLFLITSDHKPIAVVVAKWKAEAMSIFDEKYGNKYINLRLNEIRLTEKDIPRILLGK